MSARGATKAFFLALPTPATMASDRARRVVVWRARCVAAATGWEKLNNAEEKKSTQKDRECMTYVVL